MNSHSYVVESNGTSRAIPERVENTKTYGLLENAERITTLWDENRTRRIAEADAVERKAWRAYTADPTDANRDRHAAALRIALFIARS